MKALIIDDSQVMRRMLASYVGDFDIETTSVESGIYALEKLAMDRDYDFALIDWEMPRMNGIEFVKKVRANRSYDSIMLMMVTAHTSMEDVGDALLEGADDFLMKPFSKEMLGDKLRMLGLVN